MSPVNRFFHPVLAARKLRDKPVQVHVAGRPYALFRDAEGRPGALADVCPHRFARLSAGRVRPDGRLACPYHGWHFDRDGHGAAPSMPGLRGCDVEALQVVEERDYLWIGGRAVSRSAFPQTSWDGFVFAGAFSVPFEAPLHVVLDNFSETEHTPWVHTRLGWDERDAAKVEFSAQTFSDHSEIAYAAPQRLTAWQRLIGSQPGDVFSNRYTCNFDPVRAQYDLTWLDGQTRRSRGATSRVQIFMVPETERTTRLHVFVSVRLERRALRLIEPIIKPIVLGLSYWEIRDDARLMPAVAHTPEDIAGMRLTKFDKPVAHNRRLLQSLYFGQAETLRVGARRRAPSAPA